ncbi:MAG: MOSC domain-containing protein [Actinobacteria bacterium]|nr:MOSC domain-containing protein [Actinomycetota bacterium]
MAVERINKKNIRIAGKIHSINISRKKGGKKSPVKNAVISEFGIEGDGHSGNWHRQVSLLSYESISEFNKKGNILAKPGDFAENITTEGIDIKKLKIGDILLLSENIQKIIISENNQTNYNNLNNATKDSVILKVTQLGKECKKPCRIYYQAGSCIMPEEGIFCRVVKTGSIKVGCNIFIFRGEY